jgi:hypothetical protein
LREAAQNPICYLISVPFQNNTNLDIGHTDNTQNHLNPDWNLITRPILPVISQPRFLSGPELHAAEQVFGAGTHRRTRTKSRMEEVNPEDWEH